MFPTVVTDVSTASSKVIIRVELDTRNVVYVPL